MISPDMVKAFLGIPIAVALYYWFWGFMEKKEKAAIERTRIQEANIIVNHRYSPDVITAKAGKLLQVNFLRKEISYCTEEVVFPDFNKRITLPHYQVVSTQFIPERPGEYTFQCGKGKLKGKLVVSN